MTAFDSPVPSHRAREISLLLLILLFAAAVRFVNIDSRSFWLDEYLTVELSNGRGLPQYDLPKNTWIERPFDFVSLDNAAPWWRIWSGDTGDVHPPLFYLVLRAWREIGNDGDVWIRSLSTILSLVGIVMLYLAVRTHSHAAPALWAAFFMAVAGVQIDYAQECRSYMLLQMGLLVACVGVLRIEKLGFTTARGTLLGFGSLVAALTHYLAIPLLGAIALYALINLRGRDRFRTLASLCVAGVICAGLWVPFALVQARGFLSRIAFTEMKVWSIGDWVANFARVPARLLVIAPSIPRAWFLIGAIVYVLPVFVIRRNRAVQFWWLWLGVGASAIAMGDLIRGARMLDISRYTLAIGPGVYALCGLLTAHLAGWRAHLFPSAIAVACIVSIPGAYTRPKGDWRQLGSFIATHFHPGDVLVLHEDLPYEWRSRCDLVGMQYYARSMQTPVIILNSAPEPEIEARLRLAPHVWLFSSFTTQNAANLFPTGRIVDQLSLPLVGELRKFEWTASPATRDR